MNDPEVYRFINVLRSRVENVEHEWEQWKSVTSIVPRSENLWNQNSGELVCLGRLRCSQSILPLLLDTAQITIGSSSDPFTSVHVNNSLFYQDELYVRSDKNPHRVAWNVDAIGCQSWGTTSTHQRAQFSMVGRGSFNLHDVEVGLQWVRIYFPIETPEQQKDICLFIRPGDKIELDGIERTVESILEPDRVKLNEPWAETTWNDWTKGVNNCSTIIRKIRVFPMWARAYLQGSDAKPFWSITHDGRIFYKCDKLPDSIKSAEPPLEWDLIVNGSVWVNGPLQVNGSLITDKLCVNDKRVVENLNAEFINGFTAPREGEIVSTMDQQEIIRKKWGDTLDMQGNTITQLGQPHGDNDAIPRWYMEQWILGLRVHAPVRAVTLCELPEDAKWFPEEHAWKSHTKRTLINVDLRKCLDGVELHRCDNILIRCQSDTSANGIFTVEQEGDGEKNGWVFSRRVDFMPGQSCEIKSLRGTYVWCTHGTENARSGWSLIVPSDVPTYWWQEGDLNIEFEVFQQAGSFSREFGNGLHQIGGKVQLRINEDMFDIKTGQLRLRDGSILPSEHLSLDYFDMVTGPGLKMIGSSRIHIGNRCQVDLSYNPKHFEFNTSGELCLAKPPMTGFYLDSSKTMRFHYPHISTHPAYFTKSIEWINEIEPPRNFDVNYRCIRGRENVKTRAQENMWVQYWIAGITENNLLTSAVSSSIGYETLEVGDGTRWMSKLQWEITPGILTYRLWRCTSQHPIGEKINIEFQVWEEFTVDANTSQLLDIICPRGFQKLQWAKVNRDELSLPCENQTKHVVARIGPHIPPMFLQTPMSIGTQISHASVLHLEGDESDLPAIHVKMKGDYRGSAQLQWDVNQYQEEWKTSNGTTRLKIDRDLIYHMPGENGRFIIASEEWNGEESTSELSRDRLQVLQGGLRTEGRIINSGPDGYMTADTGIPGNPALIRTGTPNSHLQRALGNGVFFSWRGSQLEAIPAMDGKPSGSALPVKQFTIEHPTKSDHWLQYACLEGPSADAFIRGSVYPNKNDLFAHSKLPDYWQKFIYTKQQTVTLTPCGGSVVGLWYEYNDSNNILEIHWEKFEGVKIDYMIVGQRQGTTFNSEPKKEDVLVERWGPYTFTA